MFVINKKVVGSRLMTAGQYRYSRKCLLYKKQNVLGKNPQPVVDYDESYTS